MTPNKRVATETSTVTDPVAAMPIREGEDPWTPAEVAEVRQALLDDVERLQAQVDAAEGDLAGLISDGNDSAGRDPADIGVANFERDQEMTLAHNAREALIASRDALRAIDRGTFGYCVECGDPIGKGRLEVHPRATMCVRCKQRAERR